MTGEIRVCAAWPREHDRPRYTLEQTCPACRNDTAPAAPARFNPDDPYGEYRRSFIKRHRE